jgi:hypothetical protein
MALESEVSKTTEKTRYPNLKLSLLICFVFNLVISFFGCIAGIFVMTEDIIQGILLFVGSILYAISTFAFIELVSVLLDIEKSVRHLRKNG